MKCQDIKRNFNDEWVLIDVDKVDEAFNVVEGEVLAHSKDKDEAYRKLLEIRPEKFSADKRNLCSHRFDTR